MHPRALRELADVVAKPLTLSEKSQLAGEASDDWEKGNIAPIFKRGRKDDSEPVSCQPDLCAQEHHGKGPLGAMLRHKEDREVIWDCQHSFTKGKSCLTTPVAFYDGMTGDKGRDRRVFSLDVDLI
ncbi:hypothetical protein HGM15179_005714 [Zosterops borbonicus]|uniref:Uncharacterized protein n=1 Tax=Zosterops borbonicus TaxID=364589 RepID=A0A8K1GP97_9PASS|nr:hypothetical protein HGM15179_005714 [Zosterops borbonicus]